MYECYNCGVEFLDKPELTPAKIRLFFPPVETEHIALIPLIAICSQECYDDFIDSALIRCIKDCYDLQALNTGIDHEQESKES